MSILLIEPLPKHQMMILTHSASKEKVRGATWKDEKSYPHRPKSDGGTKGRKSMRELFAQPKDLSCMPDANKKAEK
jgi:hypothetical protein